MASDKDHKRVLILVTPTLRIGRDCWRGINQFLREQRPSWILASHPAWRFADLRQPPAFQCTVDGAIVWQFDPMPDMSWWTPSTQVASVINYELEGKAAVVVTDDSAKGHAAATHLIERGIRRFLYIGRPGKLSSLRQKGFIDAVLAAGLPAPLAINIDEHMSRNEFIGMLEAHIAKESPTIGILAYNDSLAAYVVDCCHTAGIDVPRSMSVVGVDDDELICESANPSLSSVQAPFEKVGYRAAEILAKALQANQPLRMGVEMIRGGCFVAQRRSSAMMGSNDAIIQRAMNVIRERFRDNIGVEDLFCCDEISRRAFEYRFQRALRCSPYERILRERIEHAKALLINTQLKLQVISVQCGFNSESRLNDNFYQQTGLTPREYRAQHSSGKKSRPPVIREYR